jgi:hypothetical protein
MYNTDPNDIIYQLSLEKLILAYQKLQYPIFTKGNYNLNLFGIRHPNLQADQFDDVVGVFYRTEQQWRIETFPATLDPGITYLQSPFSFESAQNGTFIIAPGFYPRLWTLGKFRNKNALLQINPVRGYRDKNRDAILDLDPKTITQGNYGILLHPHFQSVNIAKRVQNSSAGCIVTQINDDFERIITLCQRALQYFPNHFSFAVFHFNQIFN